MSFLIFDIETVPDPEFWSAETAPKKRGGAAGETSFPPHYAHRPIAIGFMQLSDELEVMQSGCAGTTMFKDDEAALLSAWNSFASQLQPVLVSYNGRGFDLPVLSLRAFRHGVGTGWYSTAYRKKYSEDQHIDLMEQLTDYSGKFAGFSLDTMSKLVGLPGKQDFDGSMVAAAFAAGKAKEIEVYCEYDVAQTAFILLRYLLMRGRIDLDKYRYAAERLLNTCGGKGMAFVENVDRKRLLLIKE